MANSGRKLGKRSVGPPVGSIFKETWSGRVMMVIDDPDDDDDHFKFMYQDGSVGEARGMWWGLCYTKATMTAWESRPKPEWKSCQIS